jgi:hypothetical protein
VNLFPHLTFLPVDETTPVFFYNKETPNATGRFHSQQIPCFVSACTSVRKLQRHHGMEQLPSAADI